MNMLKDFERFENELPHLLVISEVEPYMLNPKDSSKL